MKAPLLLTLSLLAVASNAPGAGPDERLLAGEVVAQQTQSDGSGGSARMQILVRAPARAIWDVIVSCEAAFHFVDGLEQCEVLEDTGPRALVRQVVKQGWPIPRHDFTFESLRQPYGRIDFSLVEGNLKEMAGTWRFTETADGTLVDYEIRIRPQLPAPTFIVRRNISRGMPDLLACVRALAGGSLAPAGLHEDEARCRGPAAGG